MSEPYTLDKKSKHKLLKEALSGNLHALQNIRERFPFLHWSELRYEKTGDTILHNAAKLGNIEAIKYLLDNFVPQSVDCKNNDDKTALHEAAQFAQYESAKILLEYGANVNALKRADWTPLMLACTKVKTDTNIAIIKMLLNHGALINYKNKDGWTVLHLISREGCADTLKVLIAHNLDLNITTRNGRSALHIAALHGNFEVVEILINLKASINVTDNCGNTPLHEAVLGNNEKICRYLIENGADLECRNNNDFSMIHLAASQGCVDIIPFLLKELKFNVNDKTRSGFTPLHCSAKNKQIETFHLLLKNGADDSLEDKFGRKPKDYLIP